MKKISFKKFFVGGQTAVEYMLLLTICALIVFTAFNTFFSPGGRVRNVTEDYFNKVSSNIMGDEPVFTAIVPTGGPCGAACTSFGYSDCPVVGGCCQRYLEYTWQVNPNDPSMGAGQCSLSSSGCIMPTAASNCDVYSAEECCVNDGYCASMGGGCS